MTLTKDHTYPLDPNVTKALYERYLRAQGGIGVAQATVAQANALEHEYQAHLDIVRQFLGIPQGWITAIDFTAEPATLTAKPPAPPPGTP